MCGECAAVYVCEQIARKRSGDKGFKNVPAPARQTPPINPENYTFRFPHDKKWVIQNGCPKVGRSFFGKKKHFLDSIRSGLTVHGKDVLYGSTQYAAVKTTSKHKQKCKHNIHKVRPRRASF